MMRIGLVGEAPNDTNSVKFLLEQKYNGLTFFPILSNINGSQLESQKTKRFLRREYEIEKPEFIIFIRDLDGLKSDQAKINKRKQYFTEFNSVVDKKGIFLLHIYEIEALILTDVNVVNNKYGCDIDFDGDPMLIEEPKEFLKVHSKNKFKEIHNSDIFQKISFKKALSCDYFKEFIDDFESLIYIE